MRAAVNYALWCLEQKPDPGKTTQWVEYCKKTKAAKYNYVVSKSAEKTSERWNIQKKWQTDPRGAGSGSASGVGAARSGSNQAAAGSPSPAPKPDPNKKGARNSTDWKRQQEKQRGPRPTRNSQASKAAPRDQTTDCRIKDQERLPRCLDAGKRPLELYQKNSQLVPVSGQWGRRISLGGSQRP